MYTIKGSVISVLLLLSSVAYEAHAEEPDSSVASSSDTGPIVEGGRLRMGLFLGGNYLSPDNEFGNSAYPDQVPLSNALIGLRASYLVLDSLAPNTSSNPALNLEVEGKYTFSSTEGAIGRESTFAPVVGVRANLVLEFFSDNYIVPFLLVGAGGETVFGSGDMLATDTDFAAYGGGGARFALSEKVDLRADMRLGLVPGRDRAVAGLFEGHVGASFAFGRSSTPRVLPTASIAPPDSDGDGIADDVDECPTLVETINNVEDTDGCPETDSDGDGLLGAADSCPAAAEDRDGFEDEDGCPDLDNDNDGVADVVDTCPMEAETANGYQDDDGCADEVPPEVAQFTGTIDGIQFKTSRARIVHASRPVLDAAFKMLSENPSIRIQISGHTDNSGNANANRTLSRRRADAVKWYLVDKGIDPERISTVGYGGAKPVAPNDTEEGRQQNRRIDIALQQGPVEEPTDKQGAGQ